MTPLRVKKRGWGGVPLIEVGDYHRVPEVGGGAGETGRYHRASEGFFLVIQSKKLAELALIAALSDGEDWALQTGSATSINLKPGDCNLSGGLLAKKNSRDVEAKVENREDL